MEAVESALRKLCSPDAYSRTKDYKGRRLKPIDGGWRILNYAIYRNRASAEDKRERDRLRQQRHRQSRTGTPMSRSVTADNAESRKIAQAEAEAEVRERAAASPSALPPEAQHWNSIPGVQRVVKMTQKRQQALKARRKDQFFASHWKAAIDRIGQSKFCHGVNDRGWKADFDWFLQPDSVVRIIEGAYDNKEESKPKGNCI